MLIDAKETLTHYAEKPPTRFIRDLLTDTQCPVLLTPTRFKPFKKLVLLYDGEPSSVHAIKIFSYLRPNSKIWKQKYCLSIPEKAATTCQIINS
jgi:hypothetical protein